MCHSISEMCQSAILIVWSMALWDPQHDSTSSSDCIISQLRNYLPLFNCHSHVLTSALTTLVYRNSISPSPQNPFSCYATIYTWVIHVVSSLECF